MQPHEIRVVEERDELDAKMRKLNTFMEGGVYEGLAYEDRKLLKIQSAAMLAYCEALNTRIGRFI